MGRLRPTVLLVGVLAGANRFAKAGQWQTLTRRSLSWGERGSTGLGVQRSFKLVLNSTCGQ